MKLLGLQRGRRIASSGRRHYAAFTDETALLEAAEHCRARGLPLVDAFTPYPVHGLEKVLEIPRSRLPVVTLVAGTIGLLLALWFQYWASHTNWPLDVGGKPFDSFPAFVPVAFELLVLTGGLATAAALVLRSGLRPGEPDDVVRARVTDDRFVLVALQCDASVPDEDIDRIWSDAGAVETWTETVS